MAERPRYETPAVTRSLLVLAMAEELVRDRAWPHQQAQVRLQGQIEPDVWDVVLYGSDGVRPIWQVARQQLQVAIINPGQLLALALRGSPPFEEPLQLRTITVIPSLDQLGMAVGGHTGITSFADLRERKYPLRIAIRGGRTDHCLHVILDHVLEVHGLSFAEIKSWGGGAFYDPGFPPNIKGVEAGERDAVFDEALGAWTPKAIELGMNFLRIDEPELRKLEAMGYKRAVMDKVLCQGLTDDVPTLDFGGWPVYTSAATPDDVVARLCQAIEQCKDRIPWQGEGPLPLDRMCSDTPEAPLMVPLHPAAERYWRERGYLNP